MNALTLRFALPAIVVVAIITLVAIAILLVAHMHIPGIADSYPL